MRLDGVGGEHAPALLGHAVEDEARPRDDVLQGYRLHHRLLLEVVDAEEGVVRDVQAGVRPGTAVTVSNANGLALEIVADATGRYRLPALPPGRYEVAARLHGFDTTRVVDVALVLGAQLTIDLTLRPGGVAERVEVVGGWPRLAITQATRATSLSSEEFERLPRGRDFTTVAMLAPGANDERKAGGIAIDGSTGAVMP